MKDLTLTHAELISGTHFGRWKLTPRNRDSLDFHEVSVGAIYSALNNAYKQGQRAEKERTKIAEKKKSWKRSSVLDIL